LDRLWSLCSGAPAAPPEVPELLLSLLQPDNRTAADRIAPAAAAVIRVLVIATPLPARWSIPT
jgi:hypothetical protein